MTGTPICSICLDDLFGGKDEFLRDSVPVVWKECGHTFHEECSIQAIAKDKELDFRGPLYRTHPKCPICRVQHPHCASRFCGDPCPVPYIRLYIGAEDNDQALPLPGVPAATVRLYGIVKLARDVGVDVDKLKKRIEALRGLERGGRGRVWDDKELKELLEKNKEGFGKLVNELQGQAGWERLETYVKDAQSAFDRFTTSLPLFPLLDSQSQQIQTLTTSINTLETRVRTFAATEGKLRVAEAKIAQWGVVKEQEVEKLKTEWRVKEDGLRKEKERLKVYADTERGSRKTLERQREILEGQVEQYQADLVNANLNFAAVQAELTDAGDMVDTYFAMDRRQAELQKEESYMYRDLVTNDEFDFACDTLRDELETTQTQLAQAGEDWLAVQAELGDMREAAEAAETVRNFELHQAGECTPAKFQALREELNREKEKNKELLRQSTIWKQTAGKVNALLTDTAASFEVDIPNSTHLVRPARFAETIAADFESARRRIGVRSAEAGSPGGSRGRPLEERGPGLTQNAFASGSRSTGSSGAGAENARSGVVVGIKRGAAELDTTQDTGTRKRFQSLPTAPFYLGFGGQAPTDWPTDNEDSSSPTIKVQRKQTARKSTYGAAPVSAIRDYAFRAPR